MPNFWDSIKDLFNFSRETTPNTPAVHEVIERSPEEKEQYERWKKTLSCRRLIDWLNGQHIEYLINPENVDEAIDFLNIPSSKGFVIHFQQTNYSRKEIINLFDFFKEQVLKLGYRSYVSDRKVYSREDWVESKERHYLKPPSNLRKITKEKFKQQYGNITIEILFRDEEVVHLKFSATAYNDHLFEDAKEFKELMMDLVDVGS